MYWSWCTLYHITVNMILLYFISFKSYIIYYDYVQCYPRLKWLQVLLMHKAEWELCATYLCLSCCFKMSGCCQFLVSRSTSCNLESGWELMASGVGSESYRWPIYIWLPEPVAFFQPHGGVTQHPLHEREIELFSLWSGAGAVGEAFEQDADQQSSAIGQLLRSRGAPRCCISHVLYRHNLNVGNAWVSAHLRERMKPQASQMMFVNLLVTNQGWTPSLWRLPGSCCADRAGVLLLRPKPLLGRK